MLEEFYELAELLEAFGFVMKANHQSYMTWTKTDSSDRFYTFFIRENQHGYSVMFTDRAGTEFFEESCSAKTYEKVQRMIEDRPYFEMTIEYVQRLANALGFGILKEGDSIKNMSLHPKLDRNFGKDQHINNIYFDHKRGEFSVKLHESERLAISEIEAIKPEIEAAERMIKVLNSAYLNR